MRGGSHTGYRTLVDVLEAWSTSRPDETAYVFTRGGMETARLTFFELHERASSIAASLADRPGERVLLAYPPGIDFVPALFGCWLAGVVPIPVYPPRTDRTRNQFRVILEDARVHRVLTAGVAAASVRAEVGDVLVTDVLAPQACERISISEDDLALIQYTSGSTARPKGVRVRHRHVMHNQNVIREAFGHGDDTVVVGWLPLFHDMGLIGNLLQPFYLGRPCILMSPIEFIQKPVLWLKLISAYRATTSGGPPFGYESCLERITREEMEGIDLGSWRLAYIGAEPVHGELLDRFASRFEEWGFRRHAFYPCYGLAESTLFVTGIQQGATPARIRVDRQALERGEVVETQDPVRGRDLMSAGTTFGGMEITIVDPETRLPCGESRVGEVWVSGDSVACGYWGGEEESERMFRALRADAHPARYLRTGDLGFVWRGELFITGRLKDMIIIRGLNHYAEDIERTVASSHPAISSLGCCAVAVEAEGQEHLVLIQEMGLEPTRYSEFGETIREAVIRKHEIQVRDVVFIPPGALPRTSSGKIRRRACREEYLAGAFSR